MTTRRREVEPERGVGLEDGAHPGVHRPSGRTTNPRCSYRGRFQSTSAKVHRVTAAMDRSRAQAHDRSTSRRPDPRPWKAEPDRQLRQVGLAVDGLGQGESDDLALIGALLGLGARHHHGHPEPPVVAAPAATVDGRHGVVEPGRDPFVAGVATVPVALDLPETSDLARTGGPYDDVHDPTVRSMTPAAYGTVGRPKEATWPTRQSRRWPPPALRRLSRRGSSPRTTR